MSTKRFSQNSLIIILALILLFVVPSVYAALQSTLYLPLLYRDLNIPTLTPTRTSTLAATSTPTRTPTPIADIYIAEIIADPPDNFMDEYVSIKNNSGTTVDMTGWTLRDENRNTFTFPDFNLRSGANVKVWTKSGRNTTADLYWGLEDPVWNNGGDCAYLRDEEKNRIADFCY